MLRAFHFVPKVRIPKLPVPLQIDGTAQQRFEGVEQIPVALANFFGLEAGFVKLHEQVHVAVGAEPFRQHRAVRVQPPHAEPTGEGTQAGEVFVQEKHSVVVFTKVTQRRTAFCKNLLIRSNPFPHCGVILPNLKP